MPSQSPKVKTLVLDAGPLLSLTPLRGLAECYVTTPQVVDELKDKRAREHFDNLFLTAGVHVDVRNPDPTALAKVAASAKTTGDYAVLSHADLCVLALTYSLHERERQGIEVNTGSKTIEPGEPISEDKESDSVVEHITDKLESAHLNNGPDDPSVSQAQDQSSSSFAESSQAGNEPVTLFEDPSSEDDDGEGEWITPTNAALHKSRAQELLPAEGSTRSTTKRNGPLSVGCMTTDFAMQNVLLQMGLNLVSAGGQRIERVKTWVLRCHACFKICKDPSKTFCPSCGNPTLMRASVTISAPSATNPTPELQVHLKKNMQWRNRGTIYSIPAPKPGSSKTGGGEGLILREDQSEWMRAEKRAESRKAHEEKKRWNTLATTNNGEGGVPSDWMDPDWVPEMLTVGASGKGRRTGTRGMPSIGYGRRNPNEARRKK